MACLTVSCAARPREPKQIRLDRRGAEAQDQEVHVQASWVEGLWIFVRGVEQKPNSLDCGLFRDSETGAEPSKTGELFATTWMSLLLGLAPYKRKNEESKREGRPGPRYRIEGP